MHPFDLLLLLSTLVVLLWPLLPARCHPGRLLHLLPSLNAVLALTHYWREGLRPSMVPVYLCAGLLWLFTIPQLVRPAQPTPQQHRRSRRIAGAIGRSLGVGLLGLSLALRATIVTDLGGLSWTAAFERLHAEVSRSYAFGSWKAIDWDALHAAVAPQIASAEARSDQQAYYRALRAYAFALRDSHVSVVGDDRGARAAAIGGGYGFAVVRLDDGRTLAHHVQADGPAARAGMAWGAQILAWNGQPVEQAAQQVSALWAEVPPATYAGQRIEQYRLLTRAPVGVAAAVAFVNPGATETVTATLTAVDDGFATLTHNALTPALGPTDPPVQARVLPGGYAYIRVTREGLALAQLNPVQVFQEALAEAVARDAPGMILDVRGNAGGMDKMVADIVSYFYAEPALYQAFAPYDPASGQAHPAQELTFAIEPRTPHYAGPLAVLIDPGTRSSGEGFPLALGRLPQTTVIGFAGTHGSFGAPSEFVQLPGGYLFVYTGMQSLDAHGQIQVESDASGQGGVLPELRVPLTQETLRAVSVEGRDVVLETAIQALQGK